VSDRPPNPVPKRITPLSDAKVRTVKPRETEDKIFDGGGFFLLVTPSGGKLWHFKYRFVNKERRITRLLCWERKWDMQ